jgi:twitching motility protein PilT
MAIIDTFLSLMVNQNADKLVVSPDDVPTLLKADETIRLSMPVVPRDMVVRMALQIAGLASADDLDAAGDREGTYRPAGGGEFTYRVSSKQRGYRIEMSPIMGVASAQDETPADPEAPEDRASAERDDLVTAAIKGSLEGTTPEVEFPPGPPSARGQADHKRQPRIPDPALLSIVAQAVQTGASDLFLSSGKTPHMRLDGAIQVLDAERTTPNQMTSLIPHERGRQELEKSGSVDFGAAWHLSSDADGAGRRHRFRVNLFRHSHGLGAAIRPVHSRIPTLVELNLPGSLVELCSYPYGLVLLTGASGSGKSSTLAALVEHINQTVARHIITVEDPIEFEHRNFKSLIHQREVKAHVESFSSGLRAALRENPDVIMVGEMRDPSTMSAALTAAETGHLVFSTLHTGNASAAINRMIDVFPGQQQNHVRHQIACSLRAVVAQRLVPSTGIPSRLPAIEKLIVTHGVATQIREGREHQVPSAIQTGGDEGMITMERSLAALVQSGKISRKTAMQHADNQEALLKLIR